MNYIFADGDVNEAVCVGDDAKTDADLLAEAYHCTLLNMWTDSATDQAQREPFDVFKRQEINFTAEMMRYRGAREADIQRFIALVE